MTKLFQDKTVNAPSVQVTQANITDWIVSYLAELLEISSDEIDVQTTFARYGLDSSAAVVLTGDLGGWLGKDIDPTVLYDYPTITDLAAHLAEAN